jgi:hypothetical protein
MSLSRAVDRARRTCQVGVQIDDWNDLCVGHPTLLLPAAPYCPESDAVHSRDGRNLAPEQGGWVRPLIRSSALFQREGVDFRATIAVRRRAADLRMLVGLLRCKYKKASGLLG